MHELSIAESVVEMVLERTAGKHVTVVRLRVGRFSGVVSDSLQFCFELVVAGTPLEGSELEIEETVGRVYCRSCNCESVRDDMILLCECGSADVEILSGRELQVTSVEVV